MTLFKYLVPERVEILENERIAFTPPNRFNDAYELRPPVAAVSLAYLKRRNKEAYEELKRESFNPPPAATRTERRRMEREAIKEAAQKSKSAYPEQMQDALQEEASKSVGILCLSAVNNKELMWAHYADGHRGFVIEFNCNHPRFQQLGQLWNVEYAEKRPVYNPADLEPEMQFWRVKPLCWRDEQEYRIMRRLNDRKEEIQKCGKVFYLYELPRASVKAVYLGHRLERAIRDRILHALRETSAVKYDEIPSREDYTFSFQEIS
jgi:hypothetical protein